MANIMEINMGSNDKNTHSGSEPKHAPSGAPNPMTMGMEMAEKMMARMGQSAGPMAMMQKMTAQMKPGEGGKAPMEQMMGMCMGMCGEMLTSMRQTTAMAAFATPELSMMFAGWMATLEDKALEILKQTGAADAAGLAKALSISEEGAVYLIAHLAKTGKVSLRVEAAKAP